MVRYHLLLLAQAKLIDMAAIRRDIANLIAARLEALRSNLGYRGKSHLAYAMLMFRSNWLYACINELELALVPKDKRNENYARHDRRQRSIS